MENKKFSFEDAIVEVTRLMAYYKKLRNLATTEWEVLRAHQIVLNLEIFVKGVEASLLIVPKDERFIFESELELVITDQICIAHIQHKKPEDCSLFQRFHL